VAKSVIRRGFEMNSDKAGVLKVGAVVTAQELRTNGKGTVRVRIAESQWVSMASAAGTILEADGGAGGSAGGTTAPDAVLAAVEERVTAVQRRPGFDLVRHCQGGSNLTVKSFSSW
jgi:hypothetical protein